MIDLLSTLTSPAVFKEGVSRGEFREFLVAGEGCGEAQEGEEVVALVFIADGETAVAEQPGD
ncbi:hypothetical protein [Streptomyces litmocidini]|uniref:hypothetical protein n=1 Tax=Streptomyces litmocidini TaxID=67318 RepID=UPI003F540247